MTTRDSHFMFPEKLLLRTSTPNKALWWRPATGAGSLRQGRMADDGLLEAVRGLHLAHPELGPKPLLAKLRE